MQDRDGEPDPSLFSTLPDSLREGGGLGIIARLMENTPSNGRAPRPPSWTELGLGPRSVLIFLLVLAAVAGWLYFWFWDHDALSRPAPATRLADVKTLNSIREDVCGPPTPNGRPIAFSMLYSEEKRAWIEDAVDDFARLCPNIQVKLTAMGGLQSAEALLSGEQRPLVWAPTDELIVDYLLARWKTRARPEILLEPSERTPLVRSPLVVLVWYDRLRMFQALLSAQTSPEGPWMSSLCALVPRDADPSNTLLEEQVPGRWVDWYDQSAARLPRPAAGERPLPSREELVRWDRVKIQHTSPTHSTSGFEVLYLLAYDYSLPPRQRRAAPADAGTGAEADAGADANFQETVVLGNEQLREAFAQGFAAKKEQLRHWLQRCQAGMPDFPRSTELATKRMLDEGSREFDGVVTFEHLALPLLQRIDRYPGARPDVRINYPQPTFVNEHAAYLLWPEARGPEIEAQRDAARRWLAYLRGQEQQQKAILHGFRPAIDLSLLDYDVEGNLFLSLRRHGVLPVLEVTEPPRLRGQPLADMLDVWKAAVGRN